MATKKESWNAIANLETDLAFASASQISGIQVGSTTYDLFDSEARAGVIDNRVRIDEISGMIQGGVHYVGKTTSDISDGSTTGTIIINGVSYTAKQGDMVSKERSGTGPAGTDLEFIWDGSKWNEFGSSGALKALAFKDSASGSYTPAGNVTLTDTDKTASLTNGTATAAEITGLTATTTASYTPAGSVSISYTPAGSVDLGTYTPDGSVVIPSIAPSADAISVTQPTGTGTAEATFDGNGLTATISTLPILTADAPAITVTPSTANVLNTATVTDGVLSFGSTAVLTAASAELDAAPSVGYHDSQLTGIGSNLATGGLTGSATITSDVIVNTQSVSKPISISALTNVAGTFTGTEATLGTKNISGSAATLTADLNGTTATIDGTASVQSFTPDITAVTGSVTVAVPTSAGFAGTAATITVS